MKYIFHHIALMIILINGNILSQQSYLYNIPFLAVSGALLTGFPHVLNSSYKTLANMHSTQNLLTLLSHNLKDVTDINKELIAGATLCALGAAWYYKNTVYDFLWPRPKIGLANFDDKTITYNLLHSLEAKECIIHEPFQIIVRNAVFSFRTKIDNTEYLYIYDYGSYKNAKTNRIDITNSKHILDGSKEHIFVTQDEYDVAIYDIYQNDSSDNSLPNNINILHPIAYIPQEYFNQSMGDVNKILCCDNVLIYSKNNTITRYECRNKENSII